MMKTSVFHFFHEQQFKVGGGGCRPEKWVLVRSCLRPISFCIGAPRPINGAKKEKTEHNISNTDNAPVYNGHCREVLNLDKQD